MNRKLLLCWEIFLGLIGKQYTDEELSNMFK